MSIYTWVLYDHCDFMETVCSMIVASAIAETENYSISAIVDLIVLRSLRSLNFGNHVWVRHGMVRTSYGMYMLSSFVKFQAMGSTWD